MAGIEEVKDNVIEKVRRADIEEEDDHDSLFKKLKERDAKEKGIVPSTSNNGEDDEDDDVWNPSKVSNDKEEEIEYDDDDNPIIKPKKDIGPVAALDHSKIEYYDFNKDFWQEPPEITALSEDQVREMRRNEEINVSGANVPRPIQSFKQASFESALSKEIEKQKFENPTSIQKQALPVALSGRDIIGIAKTGSGKTAAFVWPMIVHILDQWELEKGDGPIAIICAPTRELAHQIFTETKKFAKSSGIQTAAVYGGITKMEQIRSLKNGAEIVVATPGRLIDMIKSKACKMNRVTYLVLDEADKMFDMGFEPQVRSIVGQIRPDRQTLLFSATFKKKVEALARDILMDPIRINIGGIGHANQDVTQIIEVFDDPQRKWSWMMSTMASMVSQGSVIVFGSTKQSTEEISSRLNTAGFHSSAIHGDKDQKEREKIMFAFKNANLSILVATDVAARGLDVKGVKNVINFDVARNIESHTHRIGRTGRAGEKGFATTLVVKGKDSHFAGDLIRNLESANQYVPPELMEVAMQNPRFRKDRHKFGGGGRGGNHDNNSQGGRGAMNSRGRGGMGGGRGRGRSGLGFSEEAELNHPSQMRKAAPLSAQMRTNFVASNDGALSSVNQNQSQSFNERDRHREEREPSRPAYQERERSGSYSERYERGGREREPPRPYQDRDRDRNDYNREERRDRPAYPGYNNPPPPPPPSVPPPIHSYPSFPPANQGNPYPNFPPVQHNPPPPPPPIHSYPSFPPANQGQGNRR
eukprot:TRINITY_DN3379_c0_g1_i2.p1 TRINITY_DN3379_c0_g1~~TRINITY_DN3379_c0_g1_i2.p1  ORF type:complete len:756 (-),score=288.94 TRINITY_DN3379_c0_g1_i2:26-2293(-)